ncbi:MAG TPA: WGR domain-containing protein, partial [Myxococcota bacterium]|nr:WGR domain-containing protein [Myxococcota bacterium]
MPRFEFVDGSSSKFWEIEQKGSELHIAWGRIGTGGQSQIKSYASDGKAKADYDKLIKEKTGKG